MKPTLFRAGLGLALALLAPTFVMGQSPSPAPTPPAPAPVSQPPAGQTPAAQPPATRTPAAQPPAGQRPITSQGPDGTTTTRPPVVQPPVSGAQDPHDHPHPQDPGIPTIPAGPPGKLEVAVVDHDFGSMIEGEIARHTFEMKSVGENPLIIASAKPSCGCTISHVKVEAEAGTFVDYTYGQPIAPGKRVQIEAQLDTKNKRNQASSKINVHCNDPRGIVTLGLTALVDSFFATMPQSLDFGEMSTVDVREQTAVITAKRGGKFKLRQEGATPHAGVKVSLNAVNPDEQGSAERWEVKLMMGPDLREGSAGFPIQLMSDQLVANAAPGLDGKVPAYSASVLVQARVRGLISYEPTYLSYGLVRPGQKLTRTLKISCFDEKFQLGQPKSMKLVGISDAIPDFRWAEYFEVVARPAADGKTMDVDVTLNGLPEEADSSFQGRVMIETGHPSRPTVAVLFSGVCRKMAPAPAPLPPSPAPAGKGN